MNVVEGIVDDLAHGHVPNIFAEKGYNAEWKHSPQTLVVKLAMPRWSLVARWPCSAAPASAAAHAKSPAPGATSPKQKGLSFRHRQPN